ncbi:MAG: hypothetical protein ICV80_00630 [Microcoleus sp. T1-bin1]|nr:hypothetical protein [Microcoleus sp. T1-bin1]
MNIYSKNKDALSGNLLVGGNSTDALTIGGTRCARYIRLGYSVRSLATF